MLHFDNCNGILKKCGGEQKLDEISMGGTIPNPNAVILLTGTITQYADVYIYHL